jgi:hypothetical protein
MSRRRNFVIVIIVGIGGSFVNRLHAKNKIKNVVKENSVKQNVLQNCLYHLSQTI